MVKSSRGALGEARKERRHESDGRALVRSVSACEAFDAAARTSTAPLPWSSTTKLLDLSFGSDALRLARPGIFASGELSRLGERPWRALDVMSVKMSAAACHLSAASTVIPSFCLLKRCTSFGG